MDMLSFFLNNTIRVRHRRLYLIDCVTILLLLLVVMVVVMEPNYYLLLSSRSSPNTIEHSLDIKKYEQLEEDDCKY